MLAAVALESMFTVQDLVQKTRFSKNHIYREIEAGRLGAIRVGRAVRIPADSFQQWLQTAVVRIQ